MLSIDRDAAYTLIFSPLARAKSPQIVASRRAKHRENWLYVTAQYVTAQCFASEVLIYRGVAYVV